MSVTFEKLSLDISRVFRELHFSNIYAADVADEVSSPVKSMVRNPFASSNILYKVVACTVFSKRTLDISLCCSYQGGLHPQFDSWPTAAPFAGLMTRQPSSSMFHSHVPQTPEVLFEVSAGLTSVSVLRRVGGFCDRDSSFSFSAYALLAVAGEPISVSTTEMIRANNAHPRPANALDKMGLCFAPICLFLPVVRLHKLPLVLELLGPDH